MKTYAVSHMRFSRSWFPLAVLMLSLPSVAPLAAKTAPSEAEAVDGQFVQLADLAATRWSAAAVPLVDGRVLLAGGVWIAGYGLRDAEIFDPATATWSQTGDMLLPRFGMGMTRLNDGRVIVIGGVAGTDCASKGFSDLTEIWDPATGLFTTSETMTMIEPRVAAAVITLNDGRVLAAGGWDRCGTIYGSAELFDPVTQTWAATGDLNIPRYAAAPLLLADGRVLLAGGIGGDPYPALESVEIFDPATGTWSLTGSMLTKRYSSGDDYSSRGDLIQLGDGRILAAGAYRANVITGTLAIHLPIWTVRSYTTQRPASGRPPAA
jgi:hypothetical protein